MAIGPSDGEIKDALEKTQCGEVIDYEDLPKMKETIERWYRRFKQGTLFLSPAKVEDFTRKSLTSNLAALLNDLIKK